MKFITACILAAGLHLGTTAFAADGATTPGNGDADRGKSRYSLCAACHPVSSDNRHSVGPNLYGIVDREVGSADGFRYSAAMQKAEGNWTTERLDQYLADPRKYIPGTSMVLPTRSEKDRADIIAYLATLTTD